MSSSQEHENNFVAYEYKTVIVNRDFESVWKDGYRNFGWKLVKNEPAIVKHVWGPLRILLAPLAIFPGSPFAKIVNDHESETKVELKFKRDRNIPGKAELNRYQLQFESHIKEISNLENSKQSAAAAAAYTIGLLGTVFLGASTFSYLTGMIPFTILLAVPGFAGWILSYFIHNAVKGSKSQKVAPLIERQYDALYEVCAKANELLRFESAAALL